MTVKIFEDFNICIGPPNSRIDLHKKTLLTCLVISFNKDDILHTIYKQL